MKKSIISNNLAHYQKTLSLPPVVCVTPVENTELEFWEVKKVR
jgi:hypothetical protein